MAEIKTIHGGRVPGEPSQVVIGKLERLLERARAGEIIAVAYATVWPDNSFTTGWGAEGGTRDRLHTGIAVLQRRFVTEALMAKGDTDDGS